MHRPAPGTKPGGGGRRPRLGWGSGFKSTTSCTKGSAASTTMWSSSLNHGSRERRSLGSKQDQAEATGIHPKPNTCTPQKSKTTTKNTPEGFTTALETSKAHITRPLYTYILHGTTDNYTLLSLAGNKGRGNPRRQTADKNNNPPKKQRY